MNLYFLIKKGKDGSYHDVIRNNEKVVSSSIVDIRKDIINGEIIAIKDK